MKRTNSIVIASVGLLALSLTGVAYAQDFTANTQNGNYAPGAMPVNNVIPAGPTDVIAISTVQTAGRRTGSFGYQFLNIEGSGNGAFADYGLVRFDLTYIKNQLTSHFGSPAGYTIKDIYLVLSQSNASFSKVGIVQVAFTPDDTSPFGYNDSGTANNPDTFTLTNVPAGQEFISQYTYQKGGPLGPDPTNANNPNGNGFLDYVPLYGEVPADLPTYDGAGGVTVQTPVINSAANNNGANNTDLLNHFISSSKLTLALNPDNVNTPAVAASYEGVPGFFPTVTGASTLKYSVYSPYIVVIASPAAVTANLTGTITFDGVSYPHTGGIPLDNVNVTFLQGATTVSTQTVTVNATTGSYSVTAPANGTYNIRFKGPKNLSVLLSGVVINNGATGQNAALPGGDADNNNTVDIADFGILVNAYGTAQGNAQYNATSDFNDDAIVDIGDFGTLVNNYGNSGQ